jgi:hypothetical protein
MDLCPLCLSSLRQLHALQENVRNRCDRRVQHNEVRWLQDCPDDQDLKKTCTACLGIRRVPSLLDIF